MALPVSPAGAVALAPEEAKSVTRAILRARAEAERWLREDPTSYLATVQRHDFDGKRTLTFGRAPDRDLRVDDPAIAAQHLSVTVAGDVFRIEAADESADFRVDGAELREAEVGPGFVAVGRYLLRLSHQGFPALVLFDPAKIARDAGARRRYFPVDLAYRYELSLRRDPAPTELIIRSTRGNERRARRVGWLEFRFAGSRSRLEVTRLLEPGVGEREYGVYFRDATTGRETYPVGRYVEPEPLGDDRYVLDFNLAYNPACAFSDHYNCPIPSAANRLAAAIRAGEMNPRGHP